MSSKLFSDAVDIDAVNAAYDALAHGPNSFAPHAVEFFVVLLLLHAIFWCSRFWHLLQWDGLVYTLALPLSPCRFLFLGRIFSLFVRPFSNFIPGPLFRILLISVTRLLSSPRDAFRDEREGGIVDNTLILVFR